MGKDCTVKFECEGTPTTYWDVLESEDSNHEKSHTYKPEIECAPVVLIEGNISSIWFCDENGAPLADGNTKIDIIMFSNTITSIREYACYGLELEGAYIPASVKTIGKNAFVPYEPSAFFCEPPYRPAGWDSNWCTWGELARYMSWGFSYYISDDYDVYVIINDDPIYSAYYETSLRYGIEKFAIPETISINKRTFPVVAISSVGGMRSSIKELTISKNITFIGDDAFSNCTSLETVNFADKYEYLLVNDYAFYNCTQLKSIILPEGLVNLAYSMFQDTGLTSVKVPNTVKQVSGDMFWGCRQNITVDLTSYKVADSIAKCSSGMLNNYSGTITFQISNDLTENDFTAKGWPETKSGEQTVVWETVTPTSLA